MLSHFEDMHAAFIKYHLANRNGERKGRLQGRPSVCREAAASACMVAVIRQLHHLHPKYEIYDWNRKSQFLDFAFINAIRTLWN